MIGGKMYHTRLGSVIVVSVMLASLAVVLQGVDAAGAQPKGAEAAVSQSGVSGSQTNIPATAAPGEALNTIPADQAKEHIGETNTVCGLVASARYMDSTRAKPTLLNFVRPYPDHAFSVMIPNSARPKFKDPPEEFFTNKTVCVTGAIIEYRGKPEIVVNDPSQIVIKESAQATPDKTATNTVQKTPATANAPGQP
jgi:micrococcal nuclease